MTCDCRAGLDPGERFSRDCDYCGRPFASDRCEHDAHQEPCPECAVPPVPQLA